MTRKMNWSILLAGALIASAFTIAPASAAPEVPAEPNIEDPAGDGNYLNDGTAFGAGAGHNNSTPADASSVGDILKVWFTATPDTIMAHFQTERPGPASASYLYRVYVDPGVGDDCLSFRGFAPGAGNASADPSASIRVTGDCGDETIDEGATFVQEEGPDGTGLHTISIPRSANPAFAEGSVLATPNAEVRHLVGVVTYPAIDTTEVGTDYTVTSGGSEEPPPAAEPPGKNDPPGQGNQDCSKIKNKKKKKACKKNSGKGPKAEGCAAYEPGEQGAEAETVKVTDEATEEAPLEITIEQEMGMANDLGLGQYDGTAHTFRNLQVDSAAAEGGLYIRYEFPIYEDHDLYVNYANGSEAAHVGGFNATPVSIFDGTGSGGHSEHGAEQIDGLRTADCAGYTVDFSNYLGEGGEYTVKLWLGEIQNDPAPPAEDLGKSYVF